MSKVYFIILCAHMSRTDPSTHNKPILQCTIVVPGRQLCQGIIILRNLIDMYVQLNLYHFLFADMCKKHISMTQNGKTSKHGNIYSPNYPLDYQSNTECVWRVSVPENFVFQMDFLHFDTEYSHDYECSHDFMEIHYLTEADGAIRRCARLEFYYRITRNFLGAKFSRICNLENLRLENFADAVNVTPNVQNC